MCGYAELWAPDDVGVVEAAGRFRKPVDEAEGRGHL